MNFSRHLVRGLVLAALIFGTASAPRAQAPVSAWDSRITYILPQWSGFLPSTDAEFAAQVQQLRTRIGEGPRVRVGFTTYIDIDMSPVDPADTAAVRAALAPAVDAMDRAIAKGVAQQIPICLSFATALRGAYDAAQLQAESEDRRDMQWHSDNSLAPGWLTLSRYARKQEALQEAFIRELGRAVAARMAAYPDTLVAASGDGEVELSYDRSFQFNTSLTPATSLVADYSPFAVAEFRDWLHAAGLYAPGQALAGQASPLSGRYAGDASPAEDTNHDGHTLNGDFGTSFTTWDLRHFDWSLSDPIAPDPHAIPASEYAAPAWLPMPNALPAGFDAPRTRQPGAAWWDVWDQFRQSLVWRHNQDFAKWMTTSPDPVTGRAVPAERWFSDQIPADYLFGFTPDNPDFRLATSASPWWTADVRPYGSLGITSFNVNLGNGNFARTLANVAPQIAQRRVRWGVFEWNPSLPSSDDITVYRQEMALVEQYRPSLLVPFLWNDSTYPIEDTGFETALRELVNRIRVVGLTLDKQTLNLAATTAGAQTPAQLVRVSGAPGETPPWTASTSATFLNVAGSGDGRTFLVGLKPGTYAPGLLTATVNVSSTDPGYSATSLTVTVRVAAAGTTTAPTGNIDTPADGAIVTGEVPMTGWVVDDVGVTGVSVYRDAVPGEATYPGGTIYLGAATSIAGARPDVQAMFTDLPQSDRAGWGFMVLTNMLPGQGNGIFRLLAFASDVEGHQVLLGSRRIDARNDTAILPFGTIDTPAQGQTVSGTVVNFGWALAPQPYSIPVDGSTITVYIDNVPVGHPTYNNFRPDIAALFPGLVNSAGAVGFFPIDTTTLANGVHTIAWLIVDNLGHAQGVGSRYFTVVNP